MRCGLLGESLKHSYSPQIHKFFGDYSYELFEVKQNALANFLKNGDFAGLNVTMPYKKAVIPYCAELSDRAKETGAVNTIVKLPDGSLIGHNTDYYGFETLLIRSGLNVHRKKVLVLGSGGASATVVTVLKAHDAFPVVISRTGENNYSNLYLHKDTSIIVNTTPVGMYPHNGVSPINLEDFPLLEGVLDLIYNPERTKLLMDAQKRNLIAMSGLWMLIAQAKESAEWFMGYPLPDNALTSTYQSLRQRIGNTILIGMPGCGKSTIGYHYAKLSGKKFFDADILVAEKYGMSASDIISKFGEAHFRQLETNILQELGKESGCVIATGGGCVTQSNNYDSLHQNGTIIWLQRDLSQLATEGRPLSLIGTLEQMYQKRQSQYKMFADHVVVNESTPEDAVEAIASLEDPI